MWRSPAPVIQSVFDSRIGAGRYRMAHQANPLDLFRVLISG